MQILKCPIEDPNIIRQDVYFKGFEIDHFKRKDALACCE